MLVVLVALMVVLVLLIVLVIVAVVEVVVIAVLWKPPLATLLSEEMRQQIAAQSSQMLLSAQTM